MVSFAIIFTSMGQKKFLRPLKRALKITILFNTKICQLSVAFAIFLNFLIVQFLVVSIQGTDRSTLGNDADYAATENLTCHRFHPAFKN